jgi:hypothetical protein
VYLYDCEECSGLRIRLNHGAAIGAVSGSDADFQAQFMEILTNSSPPLLQVEGVSKSFGGVHALEEVRMGIETENFPVEHVRERRDGVRAINAKPLASSEERIAAYQKIVSLESNPMSCGNHPRSYKRICRNKPISPAGPLPSERRCKLL